MQKIKTWFPVLFALQCVPEKESPREVSAPKATFSERPKEVPQVGVDPGTQPYVCADAQLCPLNDPKIKQLIQECEVAGGSDCRTQNKVNEFIAKVGTGSADSCKEMFVINAPQGLALKKEASDSSATLSTLKEGSKVTIISKNSGFVNVSFSGSSGFVPETLAGKNVLSCTAVGGAKSVSCAITLNPSVACKIRDHLYQEVPCYFVPPSQPALKFKGGTPVSVVSRACGTPGTKGEYAAVQPSASDPFICYVGIEELRTPTAWATDPLNRCF
jgi:hypothetical protein